MPAEQRTQRASGSNESLRPARTPKLTGTTAGATVAPKFRILLVEDDEDIGTQLTEALTDEGYAVEWLQDGASALAAFEERNFELLLSDIRLPGTDGLTLFQRLRETAPDTPVILMSAFGTVKEAVTAVQQRAVTYLAKPFDLDELIEAVQRAEANHHARQHVISASEQTLDSALSRIVGSSESIRALRKRIVAAAETEVTVLIHGPSGTGKELVARAIHSLGRRSEAPFIAFNCASIPETLLEAELFGYEKGAFTGAAQKREGLFRAAHGGTLFLDEVGEMPLGLQAKLLRVLEQRVVQPLGTDQTIPVDVRLLSATNVELRGSMASGKFREDLFYRLRVLDVRTPPLKDHLEDLASLVAHFLGRYAPPGERVPEISPEAWAALSQYDYPGNVRELEHAMQHALALAGGGAIHLIHLPEEIRGAPLGAEELTGAAPKVTPLSESVASFERECLVRALEAAHGSKSRTAAMLGISRKSVWEKLKRYGIS
jgi:two-component system response regulator AtoC